MGKNNLIQKNIPNDPFLNAQLVAKQRTSSVRQIRSWLQRKHNVYVSLKEVSKRLSQLVRRRVPKLGLYKIAKNDPLVIELTPVGEIFVGLICECSKIKKQVTPRECLECFALQMWGKEVSWEKCRAVNTVVLPDSLRRLLFAVKFKLGTTYVARQGELAEADSNQGT